MILVADVCAFLQALAPLELAEDWDNVGLIVGDPGESVERIMTCLTITPCVADEAQRLGVNLIVTHHPLPFRPLKSITSANTVGRLLLQLIRDRVAVYSSHTAFDSALRGINQQWAEQIGLTNVRPLVPAKGALSLGSSATETELGSGRVGEFRPGKRLTEVVGTIKRLLSIHTVGCVGVVENERTFSRVGIGCGSAGSLVEPARKAGCDLFITGETNFHMCLEAESNGMALLLTGHFASERFAMDRLAQVMKDQFPQLSVWASSSEKDPIQWV